jgi:alanine racemase
MPLTLHIDTYRWRTHLAGVLARYPGIVPVIKGNGYGVGLARLAQEAERLGTDTVAVGSIDEVATVAAGFGGRIVVLQPHHPAVPEPPLAEPVSGRVVRVVATSEAAVKVAGSGTPVILEAMTSLRRHGLEPDELVTARTALADHEFAGFAMHLPLGGGRARDAAEEVGERLDRLREAGLLPADVWVSHVSADGLDALRDAHPDARLRPRIGTQLWLGDPDAMTVTSTVCDVHRVRRGERYGYRGRRAPWDGTLVVLAGGTAHGLGLQAPRYVRGLRARIALGAEFGLAELNWARGPFTIGKRRPMLAEPPHMQVSLVLLPAGVEPPAIGSEVPVQVRKTTARPDRVVDH